MGLPEDILHHVAWLEQYHQATKYSEAARPHEPDPRLRPKPFRSFEQHPKIALPTHLIGVDVVATVSLLAHRPDAIPESELNPPHDLKTLASWLFMSYGLTGRAGESEADWQRSPPSAGSTYAGELYVAAFAIEGLEAGLYHFHPREFALHRLRSADETFALLARAGANAEALRRTPGALVVSTIFSRSTWKFGDRAFRMALLDAGHLIENIVVAASGLGMDTLVNLRPDHEATQQLIGIAPDAPFVDAEAVQAIIIWTDPSHKVFTPHAKQAQIQPIPRTPLVEGAIEYPAVVGAQVVCAGHGGLVHHVRRPLTDLSPLPEQIPSYARPPAEEPHGGEGLSKTLRQRRSARVFQRQPIGRDHCLWLNHVGFRGKTYPPMHTDEDHAALVRAFWLISGVRGLDSGIWYFDPPTNTWASLARGESRMEASYLCVEQPLAGDASAICFIAANLHLLMHSAGPDLYRLAHLEAGIVSHRMQLAATSLHLGACGLGTFFDDDLRKFLGLQQTHWQVLYATAIGVPADQEHPEVAGQQTGESKDQEDADWRD